jgi:hypothetical protein
MHLTANAGTKSNKSCWYDSVLDYSQCLNSKTRALIMKNFQSKKMAIIHGKVFENKRAMMALRSLTCI